MKKLKLTKYDVSQNFRKLFLFLNILFHRGKVHNILFKRTLLKSVHYDFLFIYIKYINFYAHVCWERGMKILQNQVLLADLISSSFLHFLYGTCQIWSVEVGVWKATPQLCRETTTDHWGPAVGWPGPVETHSTHLCGNRECQAAVGRKTFSKLS